MELWRPSYGVLTFRSLSHKSEWIIVTLAPVSTNALTKMPSTDTDSKFDGCSGGICVVPIDAVFPQKLHDLVFRVAVIIVHNGT